MFNLVLFGFVSSYGAYIIFGVSIAIILILFILRLRNQQEVSGFNYKDDGLLGVQKEGIDINLKMQAYERLAIFLERTDPWRLLNTINQSEKNIKSIESAILNVLLSEFEYNLSQQVYVSDELWNMIVASKNQTINLVSSVKDSLKNNAKGEDFFNSLKLVLQNQKMTPTKIALDYLKKEVRLI